MKITLFYCLILSTSLLGQSDSTDVQKALNAMNSKPALMKTALPELRKNFDNEGKHYIKATFLAQTWVRYSELNPNSMIDGFNAGGSKTDIGVRRLRMQVYGQLTDRLFFYTQFGQNNLNYLQARHTGAFFHDAVTEFKAAKWIQIGGGLTAWSGTSRYSAPAVANILGVDAPLYQQSTIGINDQFVRKLSVYIKGELSKFQYRIALSDPFSTKNSVVPPTALSTTSNFNVEPAELQNSGYLVWQFFDKESMLTPYLSGTYYGKKKVLNIGAGWVYQKNAMWRLKDDLSDIIRTDLRLIGIDVFYESPLSAKGNALTAYLAYNNFDFGRGYYRNVGAMNVANGVEPSSLNMNGPGVAFPMIGTGDVLFAQLGYKFKDNLLPNNGTLQFYSSAQFGSFDALYSISDCYEAGVNWLIHGNGFGKLSFGVQNRPIFEFQGNEPRVTSRKNMYVLQFQISL